jgi:hypothetical protein
VAARIKQLWILCAVLWVQACTADVYVPVSHPTPLLDEKGNVSAAVYTSTNGTDLHTAYAVSDRFGIAAAANYMYRDFEEQDDFQKHKYAELLMIYYLDFSESALSGAGNLFGSRSRSAPEFKMEFLASAGLGEGEELRNSGEGEFPSENFAKGRYSKFSLQSNLAVISEVFFIGFSPKLSYVSFHDFFARGEVTDMQMSDKTSALFFEPALFSGFAFKNVRVEWQGGITRNAGANPAFNYERFYFSVGVHLKLDSIF